MSAADETLRRLDIPAPSKTRTWVTRALIAAVVTLAVVGIGAAWLHARGQSGQRYETVRVTRGDIVTTATATGSLQPLRTVDVGSQVSGRLAAVYVQANAHVHEGQILAELDTTQLRAALAETHANVSSAQAAVALARATLSESRERLDRSNALHEHNLQSTADHEAATAAVQRAEADLLGARARLEVARASVNRAQADLDHARIVSPIDGIVLVRSAEPGTTVQAAFQVQVLFQLAQDLAQMELHVDVDEADVGRVHEHQHATFTVDAYPDRTFHATIRRLHFASHVVERVVAYEAVLDVENPDLALRPGMTATASIETGRRAGVLVVPNRALRFTPPAPPRFGPRREVSRNDGHTLYVLQGGMPVSRRVEVGGTDGEHTEVHGRNVTEGLSVIVGVQREGT